MARAKTPRNNGVSRNKQVATTSEGKVATMLDVNALPEVKKHASPVPINLEDEIRRRAYELYEQRGCTPGHEHEDWLVAEREILARYSQQQSA